MEAVYNEDIMCEVGRHLDAVSLASAAQVCRTWRAAAGYVKAAPQWVSVLAEGGDLESDLRDACSRAMLRMRAVPDAAVLFVSGDYEPSKEKAMADIVKEVISSCLPGGCQLLGCTGSGIIGTRDDGSIVEIEAGDGSALSLSLAYFAGSAAVSTIHVPSGTDASTTARDIEQNVESAGDEGSPGDKENDIVGNDSQCIVLVTDYRSAQAPLIQLAKSHPGSIVCGGVAGGYMNPWVLQGTADNPEVTTKGMAGLVITPTPAAEANLSPTAAAATTTTDDNGGVYGMQTVVARPGSAVGPLLQIKKVTQRRFQGYTHVSLVQTVDPDQQGGGPVPPMMALMPVFQQIENLGDQMVELAVGSEADFTGPVPTVHNETITYAGFELYRDGGINISQSVPEGFYIQLQVSNKEAATLNLKHGLSALAGEGVSSGGGGGKGCVGGKEGRRHSSTGFELERAGSQRLRQRAPTSSGALLFSCAARGEAFFGEANHESKIFGEEVKETPLAGFFCNGEIFKRQTDGDALSAIHGFTSVYAVFRTAAGAPRT